MQFGETKFQHTHKFTVNFEHDHCLARFKVEGLHSMNFDFRLNFQKNLKGLIKNFSSCFNKPSERSKIF